MIIDYFGKYTIDTNDFAEKMNYVKQIDTEHSRYLTKIFPKVMDYFFTPEQLHAEHLYEGIPDSLEKNDMVILVSNGHLASGMINNISSKCHVMIIGKIKEERIEDHVEYLSMKHISKLLKRVHEFQNVYMGFCIEDINYLRYYYTRLKTFFLNMSDTMIKTSLEDFKQKTQETCDNVVTRKENFKFPLKEDKTQITVKQLIQLYRMLLKTKKLRLIENRYAFYLGNCDSQMHIQELNELSVVFDTYSLLDEKEVMSRIYDIVCKRMLDEAMKIGYCDFIDNKCASMRNGFKYGITYPNTMENGCCGNTYLDKEANCRYLKEDHSCSICCISCRLFTCGYLQLKGIDHSLKNYPIIDIGFNKFKKIDIVHDFFTPKEKILEKLRLRRNYR